MNRTRITTGVLFLLLVSIIAYQAIERGAHSVRLAFAQEQCQIFVDMADQASAALGDEQPNTNAAVECLEYAHNYYPSGTKQIAGSRLDAIVESSRHASEMRIIGLLKSTTGSNLGNDASVWIEHFRK